MINWHCERQILLGANVTQWQTQSSWRFVQVVGGVALINGNLPCQWQSIFIHYDRLLYMIAFRISISKKRIEEILLERGLFCVIEKKEIYHHFALTVTCKLNNSLKGITDNNQKKKSLALLFAFYCALLILVGSQSHCLASIL